MTTTELAYPFFEANQVLSNAHLNALFEYLDGQERLTRVNLIGIGIACGLEARLDGGAIHLSKGCGVTSEGYLIVQPDDVTLMSWRPYTLPSDPPYPPFANPATKQQYELWELFADDEPDEPGTQPLGGGGLDLAGKAVVLLLELRKDDLRNCSQNSCDDRGAEVTATVRRLLINVVDLDKAILAARDLAAGPVGADPGELPKRLELPDLRLPRFDLPIGRAASSEHVLAAFQAAFHHAASQPDGLAKRTGDALTALYVAVRPLVANDFPDDPFERFLDVFRFLDLTPTSPDQVRFMQYYVDLFDDLIGAYDEVRWRFVDLLCACCPPEGLFPRHLMGGALAPSTLTEPDTYRHRFLPSPAVGDCEQRGAEVRRLFRRLVAMVESFTNTPSLPAPVTSGIDTQIRITPSTWGDVPQSVKAIPYYYEQDGTPPLYELWNPEQSARRRSNQNLSYRADQYRPAAPPFVTDPLVFDLEPHNFLRVEGHLGKDVHSVLSTLLSLRDSHRLPIDVIALRAGAFNENTPIDLSTEDCRFDDLETWYATLRVDLMCFLCDEVQYFYDLPLASETEGADALTPSLQLLRTWAPDFLVKPRTLGRWIERRLRGAPHLIDAATIQFSLHAYELVEALASFAASLGDDIQRVDFASFTEQHRQLLAVASRFEDALRAAAASEVFGVSAPGLADRLDDILSRCRLERFQALLDDYTRRVRDVKQVRFLDNFLDKHPGIQHKAGVPLGGTFILVYHEAAEPIVSVLRPPTSLTFGTPGAAVLRPPGAAVVDPSAPLVDALHRVASTTPTESPAARVAASTGSAVPINPSLNELEGALGRLALKSSIAGDPDVQFIFKAMTGRVLDPRRALTPSVPQIFVDAVADMANGTVIADFFLPYLCCSDRQPIQHALPPRRLRLGVSVACTNADGIAEVTLTPDGATGAVSVQVDDGPFAELTGKLLLPVGNHTIVVRDDLGAESVPTLVTISSPVSIGAAETVLDPGGGTYHVVFNVSGGTPPYSADVGSFVGNAYTSPPVVVGATVTVTVRDARSCAVEGSFHHPVVVNPCGLPCEGRAVRRGHRFWLPEPRPESIIDGYRAELRTFRIVDPESGHEFDLTGDLNAIVESVADLLDSDGFDEVVQEWMRAINDRIAEAVGSDRWIQFEYESPADSSSEDPDASTPAPPLFGTLWIDRLECVELILELAVEFVEQGKEHAFEFDYGPNGTAVREPSIDVDIVIPPFGGARSNKCRPEEPTVPLCSGALPELAIDVEGTGPDQVRLSATVSGPDPSVYLWELRDGFPAMSNEPIIEVQFDSTESRERMLRLTAFTERGCTVMVERVINLDDPSG